MVQKGLQKGSKRTPKRLLSGTKNAQNHNDDNSIILRCCAHKSQYGADFKPFQTITCLMMNWFWNWDNPFLPAAFRPREPKLITRRSWWWWRILIYVREILSMLPEMLHIINIFMHSEVAYRVHGQKNEIDWYTLI